MSAIKSCLFAVAVFAGFSGVSEAQFVASGVRTSGYPVYPGVGVNSGYYGVTSGFGNYGLPGTYPNYAGNGLSGYGPGSVLNDYFSPIRPNLAPQTTNNMGGLIGAIKTQTGGGNSYRSGNYSGTSRRRNR